MNPYPVTPIQIISIIVSLSLLALIFFLIRSKKIREEYAILWVIIFFIFFLLSIFRGLIDTISSFLGIQYQPASIFLILIGSLFLLMLHFSIVISDMKKKINTLAMTIAILEAKVPSDKKEGS